MRVEDLLISVSTPLSLLPSEAALPVMRSDRVLETGGGGPLFALDRAVLFILTPAEHFSIGSSR